MNFEKEVLESDLPVIVDFYASWCVPCKMIAPLLDEVEIENKGRVKVVKIDVDNAYDIASKYKVMSVPTLLFFKNGEIVNKITGVSPKTVITEKLSGIL